MRGRHAVCFSLAALGAIVSTACAAPAGVPSMTNAGAGSATAAITATAAENRLAAEREADRLLSLARLPDGAQALAAAPSSLPIPAMGVPMVGSLVDRSTFWRVAMPFDQVLAWLKGHPPAGLREAGSSESSGRTSHAVGYAYSAPSTDAWSSSQLQVDVAPDGAVASLVRVDGVVVWLDPTPLRDTASGPRMRVTLAEGCPESDAGMVGVADPGFGDLDGALVPSGEATAGLVCEYAGLNDDRFHLRSQARLGPDAAGRIASAARALPLSHVVDGGSSCPFSDASVIVIALAYAGRPDVDLWLQPGGCASVANGRIRTNALTLARAVEDATR